jgi:hypothetical protein
VSHGPKLALAYPVLLEDWDMRMNRMMLGMIGLLAACQGPIDSDLDQASTRPFKCHQYDQAFIDKQLKEADSFIHNFSGQQLAVLRNDLAGLPSSHIDFLIEANRKKRFGIFSATSLEYGAAGVTESKGDSLGNSPFVWYPVRIRLLNDTTQIRYAAQHEFGHALENKFSSHFKDRAFQREFERRLRSEGDKHKSNPRLNKYPKSYLRHGSNPEVYYNEFWAEVYNSFYCSPEAQDYLKDQTSPQNSFISTYEWMSTFLEPAHWDRSESEKGDNAISFYIKDDIFMVSLAKRLSRAPAICEWDTAENKVNAQTCKRTTRATAEGSDRSFHFSENYSLKDLGDTFALRLDDIDYKISLEKE